MADIKIDEARAMEWIFKVKAEVNDVKDTCANVGKLCQAPVDDSNDFVFQTMKGIQTKLEEVWTAGTNLFQDTWEQMDEAISMLRKSGEVISSGFDTLAKKIF